MHDMMQVNAIAPALYADEIGAEFIPISCQYNTNLPKLFEKLASKIPGKRKRYGKGGRVSSLRNRVLK